MSRLVAAAPTIPGRAGAALSVPVWLPAFACVGSVGLAVWAATRAGESLVPEAGPGSVTLAMLPDTGERYLSTPLFEGIADGGDPEP